MKRLRKLLSGLLALVLLLALVGCAPAATTPEASDGETQAVESNDPGATESAEGGEENPYADLPKEITCARLDFGDVPASKGTIEDNDVTRWINENSPVKVTWIPFSGDWKAKYATMLAAGEAPDIIMDWQPETVEDYVNNGSLLELSDLVEKYGPNLIANTPEDVMQWGYYNGGLYAIPKIRSEPEIANWQLWIRKDWLENLGLNMPTTTEELLEVMRAFTHDDPDGNGQDDTYGFALSGNAAWTGARQLENLFGVRDWILQPDGTLERGELTQNKLEAIKYIKTIYDEGLTDPEFFTQKSDKGTQDWLNGRVGIYPGGAGIGLTELETMLDINPNADPVPLKAPESPIGHYGLYQERECDLLYMVPTSCKNPQAVIEFLDWMIAGAWEPINHGVEGVHYKKEDGKIIRIANAEQVQEDLNHRKLYTLVTAEYRTAEDVLASTPEDADPLLRKTNELTAEAIRTALSVPYGRVTPTSRLGLAIVSEKMPTLTKVAEDNWNRAVIEKDMQPEEALEKIKSEWAAMGYDEMKQEFNQKAKELGYIK